MCVCVGVCKLDAEVSRIWTTSLVEAKLASCSYLNSPQVTREEAKLASCSYLNSPHVTHEVDSAKLCFLCGGVVVIRKVRYQI